MLRWLLRLVEDSKCVMVDVLVEVVCFEEAERIFKRNVQRYGIRAINWEQVTSPQDLVKLNET